MKRGKDALSGQGGAFDLVEEVIPAQAGIHPSKAQKADE